MRDGDVHRLGAARAAVARRHRNGIAARLARLGVQVSTPVAGLMLAPVGRSAAVYVSGSPSSLVAVTGRLSVCPSATVALVAAAGKIGAVSVARTTMRIVVEAEDGCVIVPLPVSVTVNVTWCEPESAAVGVQLSVAVPYEFPGVSTAAAGSPLTA